MLKTYSPYSAMMMLKRMMVDANYHDEIPHSPAFPIQKKRIQRWSYPSIPLSNKKPLAPYCSLSLSLSISAASESPPSSSHRLHPSIHPSIMTQRIIPHLPRGQGTRPATYVFLESQLVQGAKQSKKTSIHPSIQ